MDVLSVSPVSPTALAALASLRPIQIQSAPPAQNLGSAGSSAGAIQDLAQTLFQRTLQTATLFPVAEPTTGTAGLLQDVTASLLASLTAPPAPVDTTAVPTATTNPTVVQPTDTTTTSTAPTSAPPLTTLPDQPAVQDAFASSLSPDFAAQTALRFGAGVGAQAALAVPTSDLGAGLVRDATRVLRTENLQPRSGGPGPEAFAQAQSTIQRILRTYETTLAVPVSQGTNTVDLLA